MGKKYETITSVLRKFSKFDKNSISLSFISLSLFVTTYCQNNSRTYFLKVQPQESIYVKALWLIPLADWDWLEEMCLKHDEALDA